MINWDGGTKNVVHSTPVILMVMDTMTIRPKVGIGANQFAYLASALERSAGVSGGPGKVRRGVCEEIQDQTF